jgi:hypothetical protein
MTLIAREVEIDDGYVISTMVKSFSEKLCLFLWFNDRQPRESWFHCWMGRTYG